MWGTLDLDIDEEINIESSDENALPNDLGSSERAVINYYIDNQETIFEKNDTDESDYECMLRLLSFNSFVLFLII